MPWTHRRSSRRRRAFFGPAVSFSSFSKTCRPARLDLATGELLTRRTARLVAQKVGCSLLGRTWPLQPDHVRLTEDGLRTWAADRFDITARRWANGYLSFEMRRRESAVNSLAK